MKKAHATSVRSAHMLFHKNETFDAYIFMSLAAVAAHTRDVVATASEIPQVPALINHLF
jgi:hypothetical protein